MKFVELTEIAIGADGIPTKIRPVILNLEFIEKMYSVGEGDQAFTIVKQNQNSTNVKESPREILVSKRTIG